MDRLISFSKLVVIRVEEGKKCCSELTLHNMMYTMPVAYKIHPMKRTWFSVHPQSGIIAPLSTTKVAITYLLSPHTNIPESALDYDNMFQLHSVVVPNAMAKIIRSFSNTNNPVQNDWFTKKSVFIDYGKIMLVGPQILTRLIHEGSVEAMRELFEESDPNWQLVDSIDENGQTLLHLAIAKSRSDIVQLLLELGSDVEILSRSGLSPLEFAVATGETLISELLLARNACIDRRKTSEAGPIHYASWAGHLEILRMLLHKGAQINDPARNGETALHLAVKKQKGDCARLLLASGANIDSQNILDRETPLHIATRLEDEEMVKLLVKKGANKHVRNRFGKTPYHIADENSFTSLFDTLRLGDSLCLASREGETRVIHRLLEEGASINSSDQNKWTALHRASFKGKIDAVKELVKKGINVNSPDEEGYTALHCAVETGHTVVVNYLLKNGADVEKKTKKGVTALQISKSLGYFGITKILEYENKQDVCYSQVSFTKKFKGKEVIFGDIQKKSNGRIISCHI